MVERKVAGVNALLILATPALVLHQYARSRLEPANEIEEKNLINAAQGKEVLLFDFHPLERPLICSASHFVFLNKH